MANLAYGNLTAVLPTKNVDRFKDYFLDGTLKDHSRGEYFYRTYITDDEVTNNNKGMSLLRVSFECAWSVSSCMMSLNEGKEGNRCILLEEAIKECDVKRLTLWSSESGIGFEESIAYKKGEPLDYQSRELYKDPLDEYLRDEDIYEGGNKEECQIL